MKKLLAVCTTALLAIGLAMVGSLSASAHTGYLSVSVDCNTADGSATATWTLSNDYGLVMDVTASDNAAIAVGSTVAARTSGPNTFATFTQAIPAPAAGVVVSASLDLHWSDGFTQSNVTASATVSENCTVPVTPLVEFSFSTDCGSLTLVTTTTNVNANWYYGIKASVGPTQIGSAVVKGSGTKTTVIPFAEDSYGGSVVVDVETYASTEQDLLPAGWELGVKHPVTVDTDCVPPVLNVQCEVFSDGGTSTNQNANGWVIYDTRSAGHAEYVDGGLHVYTDDASSNAKVSWAHAANIPLKDVGQLSVDYTNNEPGWFAYEPGLNLFVDITDDGVSDGTLVYEEVYGQDLWVTNGSALALKDASLHTGGNGSANHGTINHYLTTFPDATVVGFAFSLGSGVHADGVLHSINFGCATYSFDYENIPTEVNWNIEPVAPQCAVDGALPTLVNGAHYTLAYDRVFDGPGEYTVTATAADGYVISGDTTKTITVEAALLYQSDNSEAECYVPPKEDDVTVTEGTPKCDATKVDVTTTIIHYTLNPETGEFVAGEPSVVKSQRDVRKGEVEACPGLAFTGSDLGMPLGIGGLALLLVGGAITFGRKLARR